jgi:hypothetical protein
VRGANDGVSDKVAALAMGRVGEERRGISKIDYPRAMCAPGPAARFNNL